MRALKIGLRISVCVYVYITYVLAHTHTHAYTHTHTDIYTYTHTTDADRSGYLTLDELFEYFEKTGMGMTREEVEVKFR